MFDFLVFTLREGLFLLAGAFVAWQIPQPQWAKDTQAWVSVKYAVLKASVLAKFNS